MFLTLEDVRVIYVFRKEFSKWKIVLWPVLISLGLSSLVMVQRSSQLASVITVNGSSVSMKEFEIKVNMLREQIGQLRAHAQASGINPDTFLRAFNLQNPQEGALESIIQEKVIECALAPLSIVLHEDIVSEELLKTLPPQFLDASGKVNQDIYREYMRQRRMNIVDYENKKEGELLVDLFGVFVRDAAYVPSYLRKALHEQEHVRKKFIVAKVSFDRARAAAERHDVEDIELEKFYDTHKEQFRVPENRSFTYWKLSPKEFEGDVKVKGESLERFYQKNKTTLFRIPPRVKVRHIFMVEGSDIQSRMEEFKKTVEKNPKSFSVLASKYSQEKETAIKGGLRDFFSRGTYDKDFEKAAFRLREPNEVSPVIKTERGYELIQLVERISAQEKPFDLVKKEVEKAVRARQSLEVLRSYLESIRKDASSNKKLLKKVTNKAEGRYTCSEVIEGKIEEDAVLNLVVQHGFKLREVGDYTFFLQEGNYVLVLFGDRVSSRVPKFKEARKQVEDSYYAEQGSRRVKEQAKRLHLDVLAGKDICKVADTYDALVFKSRLLKIKENDEEPFKGVSGLLKRSFLLTDEKQALFYQHEKDVFIVKLASFKKEDAEKEVEPLILEDEHQMLDLEGRKLYSAFIASLIRSAKIEVNQKILGTSVGN